MPWEIFTNFVTLLCFIIFSVFFLLLLFLLLFLFLFSFLRSSSSSSTPSSSLAPTSPSCLLLSYFLPFLSSDKKIETGWKLRMWVELMDFSRRMGVDGWRERDFIRRI